MKIFRRILYIGIVMALLILLGGRASGNRTPGIPEGFPTAAMAQSSIDYSRLLNKTHPLPDDYLPGTLVCLYEQQCAFKLASSEIYLESATFEAANAMFAAAEEDGVDGFILTSGYRTEEKQRSLYEQNKNGTAAAPGTSEHQTGLAMDVTARGGPFEETEQFAWLAQHCWEYGFILRYPDDREEITGIPYEPWHYRYVGETLAQLLHENGWTLEEYYERI